MVCTHGNVDVACARFGQPIYQNLRKEYACSSTLRVWRCSHFGGHQFAPTLADFPTGQVWGHLEPEILDTLVHRNQPVANLQPFYRGWSGLGQFEQIAEREIWMQRGWDWLNFRKSGQTLTAAGQEAESVSVRITFASPDGREAGSYEATVEASGSVMSALNSGQALTAVKQYRVRQLTQML